jgi:hypothetical protein
MLRYLGALLLGISLLTPVKINAQDHDRDHQQHLWNEHEDPYWHQYLKEHHKKDKDWARANKREQRDYWKWRDAHPDAR